MEMLPPFVRKLLALGLLAAVLGAAYVAAIRPVEERIVAAVDRLESGRRLLTRYEDDAVPARTPPQSTTAADPASPSLFLDGESDAVMAAKLQAVLREAGASKPGLRLTSTRTLAAREVERLKLIGIEARLVAGLPELQRLLSALDASRPVVLVETLQMTPIAERGPDDAAKAETFDVRLDLYGVATRVALPPATGRAAPDSDPADAAEPRPQSRSRTRERP